MDRLTANSEQNASAARWGRLSVYGWLHKKFRNALVWWHTSEGREKKGLIRRSDGKCWQCEERSVFSHNTQRFIVAPSGVWPAGARWTTQSPYCHHHHHHHPPPTVFKGFFFYDASMGENLEVRMIRLVFHAVANMWPLPAGLHPSKSWTSGIVPNNKPL